MRIAKKWEQYSILDTSSEEKLEDWNGVKLIRPDPQIIWKTPKNENLWNSADGHYHRSSSGGGSWEYRNSKPQGSWKMSYGNLTFKIKPTGFKHTGLFPEQAVNWDFMRDKIRESGSDVNILNLFAYTGGATLACAEAGASVCHVDASKGMVAWARENAQLSGLSDKPVRWIVDDCEKFVKREIRRGKKYDGIVMDPPSYGRGSGGEIWKLEDSIYDLVELCSQVLTEKPLFFLLNSYTTGLSPAVMAYILDSILVKKFGGSVTSDEIGLPVKSSNMALPCGSTAIWQK
ncbi:MAG: class I SAM-dependent methyltransferase [Oscillospiraceae bacterium]|nr:class I SAM-dependent methyltransferase [Oscillospiraceae bacterium]MDD6082511.1 class I SAM-dependent methyltransferase [Oscillospiraceae bacterium]